MLPQTIPAVRAGGGGFDPALFLRVKTEVDLRRLLAPKLEAAEDFGRYVRSNCINPEHKERNPSLLVYADQCRCFACSFRADALDVFRLYNPAVSLRDAATALLSDPALVVSGDPSEGQRIIRALDPDLALRYHFDLFEQPARVRQLLDWSGFSLAAVRHFRLGLAWVLARLKPDDDPTGAEGIEWREKDGRRIAYQWQWRWSAPAFANGTLRQVIYRRIDGEYLLGEKVTMERGAGTALYNGDALSGAATAIVAGGWGDCVALWQYGLTAVASTNGDGHYSSEWTPLLQQPQRVYSLVDADAAGQRMRARLERDIPTIRHIELPFAAGSKADARDLLRFGVPKATVLRLLRQADIRAGWRAFGG